MKLPKKIRAWMSAHAQDPRMTTQREVMNRLGLKRNYHKFYSLFYRTHIHNYEQSQKDDD